MILSSGVIASIGAFFNGNVDLATCVQNKEIVSQIPNLRRVYYFSRDNMDYSHRLAKYGLLRQSVSPADRATLAAISRHTYTHAISLRRFIRSSAVIIMKSVRALQKHSFWEYPTNLKSDIVTREIGDWDHGSPSQPIRNEALFFKDVLQNHLGIPVDIRPAIKMTAGVVRKPQKGLVGLGIGGSSSRWPPGNWLELAGLLAKRGYRFALFGGPEAVQLGEALTKRFPGTVNHVTKLNFAQSVAPLAELDFYIGNDTGFSHFASLIDLPVFVVLGGGTFRRFFPWQTSQNQYLIYQGMECFDCSWLCRHKEKICMQFVTPGDVDCYVGDVMSGQTCDRHRDLSGTGKRISLAWRFPGEKIHATTSAITPR